MQSKRHGTKATAAGAAKDGVVGKVRSIGADTSSRPCRTSAGQQLAVDTIESGSLETGPNGIQISVEVAYELSEP